MLDILRSIVAIYLPAISSDRPTTAAAMTYFSTTTATTFVYAGQGAQWPGMGVKAYVTNRAFRDTIDRLAADADAQNQCIIKTTAFPPATNNAVSEQLHAIFHDGRVAELSKGPALTAYQIAATNAMRAAGVEPDIVIGFSLGEVAAAYACGALTETEAFALSIARTALALEVAPVGCMAVTSMNSSPGDFVDSRRTVDASGCYIACFNSFSNLTVAGPSASMAKLEALVRLEQ